MSVRRRGGYTTTRIPPASWTQCHAYMERKARFCRCERLAGSNFCGAHPPEEVPARPRIPCPYDPTHTIYHDMISMHAKKCPKLRELRRQQAEVYYCQDCNTGGSGSITVSEERQPSGLEWAQQVALRVIAVHQKLFASVEVEDPRQVTLEEIQGAIPLIDPGSEEMDAGLEHAVAALRIKSGGLRHLRQQASFIGHLRRVGALEPLHKKPKLELSSVRNEDSTKRRTVLEVGAGRGITGLLVAGVSAATLPTNLVMVEREAPRGRGRPGATKPDDVSYQMDISRLECKQIKCDLAHVKLDLALDDASNDILVVAKHLCGCGTDLALKALIPLNTKISTIIMSTCCHGVCNWNDFVGRDYVHNIMTTNAALKSFGAKEFELLQLWSAGTVKAVDPQKKKPGERSSTTEEEHKETLPAGISSLEYGVTKVAKSINLKCGVHGLGRACQRIIDLGRLEYIKHELAFGDQSQLLYYVPDSTTPQNALLIAHRSKV